MEYPMKIPFGSVFIAWTLSFCLAVPAIAQSNTQAPSSAPPPAATAPDSQQAATPANPDNNQVVSPVTPAADSTAADMDAPGGTPAGVKSGSKQDVDAIGNRNVGGRGIGD